jgi:hypothetical protein
VPITSLTTAARLAPLAALSPLEQFFPPSSAGIPVSKVFNDAQIAVNSTPDLLALPLGRFRPRFRASG